MEVDDRAIGLIRGCDLHCRLSFAGANCLNSAAPEQETTERKLVWVIVDNQDSHA
jgi:hypothetical protein